MKPEALTGQDVKMRAVCELPRAPSSPLSPASGVGEPHPLPTCPVVVGVEWRR